MPIYVPLPPTAPIVIIQENGGGPVDEFARRIIDYTKHHILVRIEGDCLSACTMVTHVPKANICVTDNAVFGFHQAYYLDERNPYSPEYHPAPGGTFLMMRMYPKRIRNWIAAHGGLVKDMFYLRGAELFSMFHRCP